MYNHITIEREFGLMNLKVVLQSTNVKNRLHYHQHSYSKLKLSVRIECNKN